MSTHNMCFCQEIRKKYQYFFVKRVPYLELWYMQAVKKIIVFPVTKLKE